MAQPEHDEASQLLINFLGHFTSLMEKQLSGIRQTMLTTVDQVMEGVNKISETTGSKRLEAESVLEKTYITPDVETEVLVEDLQKMVSDLFEEAQDKLQRGEDLSALSSADPEILLHNRIKRFDGKFHAEMNRLSQLDDNLKSLLLGMMGALSSEDVVAQRMDHVIMALKVLQTALNYILIDYGSRCKVEELKKVTSDVKNYTYRQYTSEDEKEEFFEFFPEVKTGTR
ncbi:MAG: hypothetical protein ACOH5I_03500 [Oligoflexus sp.]